MKSLLIIGAGPGGYECAVRAAKAGLDVHIADKADHLGGTCLNEGCIPTKCLCHTAEVLELAKSANVYGVESDLSKFNIAAAVERKDKVVAQLQQGISTLLTSPGITYHEGTAKFEPGDAHTVIVGDETIHADYVFIATGSVPKYLPVEGAHSEGVLTSTELLQITEIPQRLCIIGGGVIGLEFAGIFNSFGSKVTVIEFCKEILPNFDRDIAKRLRTSLKKRGIEFVTGAPVTAIHRDEVQNELHVSYEFRSAVHDCVADKVLMAVGRGANINSLNLAEAGIEFTPRGIKTDDNMLTNVPGVYAVGDINGRCQLAHAATFQSYHALAHILGQTDEATNLSLVPAAVFTTPEAAMVGITEDEAKDKQITVNVHKSFYRANGRALAMDAAADGLVKIVARPDGKILGAHILGAHASELIHEITILMSMDGTLNDIKRCIHAHPTLSELVLQAAD